jgi:hypothetical protein
MNSNKALSNNFCASHFRPYKFFLGLFLLLIWLNLPPLAFAIGPGTGGSKIRISDEKVGPYVLLVATSPLPVTVGQMSVWVRVTDGQTGKYRPDAVVMIQATPREGNGPALTAQATHQNAGNDYDYVGHLAVGNTGQWDVSVSVKDELGQADVSFSETVTRGLSLGLILGLAIPFVVLGIVVGYYLWRRSAGSE